MLLAGERHFKPGSYGITFPTRLSGHKKQAANLATKFE